jgi:geranylgeranyl reductase family protein
MTTSPVDVAVVGGGPAGTWAAYRLARAGARVAIVDGSHPREKPCGGGVTGRALAVTAAALDPRELPLCRIRSARFIDPAGGPPVTVPLDDDALVVASRADYDGRLLDAAVNAGANLVRARVRDVARRGAGFALDTAAGTVTAGFVIGADGANSLVRRRLGRPFARGELSIATGFFAHGHTGDQIVIELATDPPGYCWSFPRPQHLAIGICAQADAGTTASALRARTAQWIERTALADQTRLEPYSWPIPSLSPSGFGGQTVCGPGWFLAGDAAGLVDPITREGIYFALRSAEFAADAALAGGRAHARYRERITLEIIDDLALGARYKAGFFQPRFTRLLLTALRESSSVRRVMAELVAGRRPYATLKWALAGTLELGLAWRLLRAT